MPLAVAMPAAYVRLLAMTCAPPPAQTPTLKPAVRDLVPVAVPAALVIVNVELNEVIGPRNCPGMNSSVCAPMVTVPDSVNVPAYGAVEVPLAVNV